MKMRSAYSGSIPMPSSAHAKTHSSPRARRPRSDTRGGPPSPWNFSALPIRFWKTAASSAGSPRTAGSGPASISRAALLDRLAQARERLAQDVVAWRRPAARPRAAADAREREQVVDQLLHRAWRRRPRRRCTACRARRAGPRSAARSAGRSSRPCAAAPAGRARRRRRTAPARRSSASARAPARRAARAPRAGSTARRRSAAASSRRRRQGRRRRARPRARCSWSNSPRATRRTPRPSSRSGRVVVRRSASSAPTMPIAISTTIAMKVAVRKSAACVRSRAPRRCARARAPPPGARARRAARRTSRLPTLGRGGAGGTRVAGARTARIVGSA